MIHTVFIDRVFCDQFTKMALTKFIFGVNGASI